MTIPTGLAEYGRNSGRRHRPKSLGRHGFGEPVSSTAAHSRVCRDNPFVQRDALDGFGRGGESGGCDQEENANLTSETIFKTTSKTEVFIDFLPTCSKYQTLVFLEYLRILHTRSGS